MKRWVNVVAIAVVLPVGVATRVPAALAFPHRSMIGTTEVLSDTPIHPLLAARISRADALVTAAGLADVTAPRTIVLTNGGWRWRVLAVQSYGAFGVRRPFSATLIFNQSDVEADKVYTNADRSGRSRSLSGTIAHEATHMLVARRIGEIKAMMLPTWKSEGFADYVAQESTLSPEQAEQVRRSDVKSRALVYFDARRRVAEALRRNPSIDALLD